MSLTLWQQAIDAVKEHDAVQRRIAEQREQELRAKVMQEEKDILLKLLNQLTLDSQTESSELASVKFEWDDPEAVANEEAFKVVAVVDGLKFTTEQSRYAGGCDYRLMLKVEFAGVAAYFPVVGVTYQTEKNHVNRFPSILDENIVPIIALGQAIQQAQIWKQQQKAEIERLRSAELRRAAEVAGMY